jgi:putative addiction module CopG family antidote
MRTTQQYSITLPIEMAAMIERKIEEGYYASVSEAIRDGVRELMDKQAAYDRWLQEVVESFEESRKSGAKFYTSEEIRKELGIEK